MLTAAATASSKKLLAPIVAVGMLFSLTTALAPAQAAKTTMVVGSTQGIPQLNPITRTFAYDQTLYGVLWSALTKYNQNGTVGPDLATSWTANAAATQWTFNLRAGAKFSDGSPIDGKAVKAVIEYVLDPKTVTQEIGNVKMISKVTVSGNKVIIDLSAPNALLPVALAGIKMIKVI